MTDNDKPPTLEDVGARLKALQDAAAEKQVEEQEVQGTSQGLGVGFRIGIELVAAVIVGFAIGWFLDNKLNTKPIFMLAFVALGFAAGVLAVLRILKGLDQAVGYGRAVRDKDGRETTAETTKKPPPNAWDDDDD